MLSSIEKLQKFIKLEVERGYDNRAVVGGLDKILPSWEQEARANHLDETFIQTVSNILSGYPALEPEQRAESLSALMSQLEQHASASNAAPLPSRNEAPPRPAPESAAGPEPKAEEPRRSPQRQPAERPPAGQPRHSGAKVYVDREANAGLNAPVKVLPGVGNKLSQTLSTLGLNTLEDLLYYFPRRYDDYSQLKPINRLVYGEETTVLGTIQSIVTRPIRGGKVQMTEATVTDGTGFLRVSWFNQPWLASKFSTGTQVVLAGRVTQYLGRAVMSNPDIEAIEQEHLHTNRIVPVYALTARLNQKNLRRMMYQTVTYWAPRVVDYLPERVRSAVKVIDLGTALTNVHFPESQDMLDVARWRLAFDEIFLLQLGVLRQKRSWQSLQAEVFETPSEWLEQQVTRLPFQLTGAQKRVLEEVRKDLASGRPMDRLVQGDVGSGKTAVAALAVAMVARAGGQAAVMAPTGILAEQHYRSFTRLLTKAGKQPEQVIIPEPVVEEPPAPSVATHPIRIAYEQDSETVETRWSFSDETEDEAYEAYEEYDEYEESEEIEESVSSDSAENAAASEVTSAPLHETAEIPAAEAEVAEVESMPAAADTASVTSEAAEPVPDEEPVDDGPDDAPLLPEEIRLLTGDTPESERQEIYAGLLDGSIKLLIGTHALIEDPVQFKHLQLAVIDEQHRFGVAQRSALRTKGNNPHLLVMTATPIPRSLALTVYGDLDLSVMDEMPPGRQPVGTHVLRPVERERAYTLIRSQVEKGHQAFIIYPKVEQAETSEEEQPAPPKSSSDMPLLSAVEEHQRLQKEVFRKRKVGLLHGRMKPEEKDQVMRAFRDRQYDILVSTTVVEVGVDVPNATVMLIEGANRFGLAQLHQLRGRVGRGGEQSFCLLIPDSEDAIENERLAVMSETNDGFVLAERDLQQRGPGDFLGTRQAGFSELRMANLTDVRLIEKARQQAQMIFQNDPDLTAPEHQQLVKKMQMFWEDGRGDIS